MKFIIYLFILFFSDFVFADNQISGVNNESFVPLFLLCVFIIFFYFFFIRPQNKRDKALKVLRDNLSKGDEVIILHGVLATVLSVKEQWVIVSISNNCEIIIQKNAIMQEVPKGTIKSQLVK